MSVLSGKEFNNKYRGKKFVKLTNREEKHNGFEFKSGLNVDIIPFNPKDSCRAGGIYFCELGKLSKWLEYGYQKMYYARYVSIPDDAQVYEEEDKWKADSLVLGEREEISKLRVWDDEKYCMEAVRQNGSALQYVRDQRETICLEAVRENGYALKYVNNQTEEISLEAVKESGLALKYVRDRTEEICRVAMEEEFYALQYGNL